MINPLVHVTKAGAILCPRGKTSILHVDDVLDQCLGIVRIVEIHGPCCHGWWKTLLKQASENRFNAGFGGGIPGYGILDWSGHGAKFYFAKVRDIEKDWCVCVHMFSFKASRKFGTMYFSSTRKELMQGEMLPLQAIIRKCCFWKMRGFIHQCSIVFEWCDPNNKRMDIKSLMPIEHHWTQKWLCAKPWAGEIWNIASPKLVTTETVPAHEVLVQFM